MSQQLVARLKKTSKYADQAPAGGWFDVRVVDDFSDYKLRGNANRYRMQDVVFGVRVEDKVIEIRPK